MNFYKTAQVLRLTGVVALSDAQAKVRTGRLAPVEGKNGLYELSEALDFKAGELVGLEEIPKGMRRAFVGGDSGGDPIPHDQKTGEPIAAAEKPAAAKPAGSDAGSKPSGKAGGKAPKPAGSDAPA